MSDAQVAEPAALLTEHSRHEIDHWRAKFPEGRQRSAVISALRVVQHQNNGVVPIVTSLTAGRLVLADVLISEQAVVRHPFRLPPWQQSRHLSGCDLPPLRSLPMRRVSLHTIVPLPLYVS